MPLAAPDISEDMTLCPGFSLVAFPCVFWSSSLLVRSSSIAAAPVKGAAENLGDTFVPNRGDFAIGETVRPASAIDVSTEAFGDESGRGRFSDLTPDWSALD